jgi:hypothetical protein
MARSNRQVTALRRALSPIGAELSFRPVVSAGMATQNDRFLRAASESEQLMNPWV